MMVKQQTLLITIYHHAKNNDSLTPFAAVISSTRRNLELFAFVLYNIDRISE